MLIRSDDRISLWPMAVFGSVGGSPRVLARRALLREVCNSMGPARLPSTPSLVRCPLAGSWGTAPLESLHLLRHPDLRESDHAVVLPAHIGATHPE
jgi:hypothetical protein